MATEFFLDSVRCYITRIKCDNQIEPNINNSSTDDCNLTKDRFFKVLKNGTIKESMARL